MWLFVTEYDMIRIISFFEVEVLKLFKKKIVIHLNFNEKISR